MSYKTIKPEHVEIIDAHKKRMIDYDERCLPSIIFGGPVCQETIGIRNDSDKIQELREMYHKR